MCMSKPFPSACGVLPPHKQPQSITSGVGVDTGGHASCDADEPGRQIARRISP